jgi:hypothetical protein
MKPKTAICAFSDWLLSTNGPIPASTAATNISQSSKRRFRAG